MKFSPEKTGAAAPFPRSQGGIKKNLGPRNSDRTSSPVLKTKDTQIVFRTTLDNKESLRSFFADRGLTLSRGIQLACLYLEQQIRSGDVEVSPAGLLARKAGW